MRLKVLLTATLLSASLFVFGQDSVSNGRSDGSVVGMWKLVSWTKKDGSPMRGDNPQGIVVYDQSGHFSIQVMSDYLSLKKNQPTPEDVIISMARYVAYFGTYTQDAGLGVITHHVKGSIRAESIGTEYLRKYELGTDGAMVITPQNGPSDIVGTKMKWERL